MTFANSLSRSPPASGAICDWATRTWVLHLDTNSTNLNITIGGDQVLIITVDSNTTISTHLQVGVGTGQSGVVIFDGDGCVVLQGTISVVVYGGVENGQIIPLVEGRCLDTTGVQLGVNSACQWSNVAQGHLY
jgi:hypothetical protein